MSFENIKVNDKNELQLLANQIIRLNKAKLDFNIQELQIMDVSNEDRIKSNSRVFKELNRFLNSATDFTKIVEKKENTNYISQNSEADNTKRVISGIRKSASKDSIKYKKVHENIDVALSDSKSRITTLADFSFKVNKYTKWICEDALSNISNKNEGFRNILHDLNKIYLKMNSEDKERIDFDKEIKKLVERTRSDYRKYAGWEYNLKGYEESDQNLTDESKKSILKKLYHDSTSIFNIKEVLYEIKTQLNKQLVRELIIDNYENFTSWGFSTDENHNCVLNFNPNEAYERYAFHIPDLKKILNESLIRKVMTHRGMEYKSAQYDKTVRKNSLNKIDVDNKSLGEYYEEFFDSLQREDIYIDQLIGYKFMSKKDRLNIQDKAKELGVEKIIERRINEIETLLKPSEKLTINDINDSKENSEFEEIMKKRIEENLLKYRKIFVQYGENLDKNASVYALIRHIENYALKNNFGKVDIEVREINAGEDMKGEKGLYVDAGKLRGTNIPSADEGEVNADVSKGERSTCGKLAQYGIYVPHKIVQYADKVITDERALDARHGTYLCRKLKGEKLFKFGEERREDGKYLIGCSLTDDELEKYGLTKDYKEREKNIKKNIQTIYKSIYKITNNEKKDYMCIVDQHVDCGNMIAYGLGCKYYASVADKKAEYDDSSKDYYGNDKSFQKATFAITANPSYKSKTLPTSILKYCKELEERKENDTLKLITVGLDKELTGFVRPTGDLAVFGGPKAPNLFVTLKNPKEDDNVKDVILNKIKGLVSAEKAKPEEIKRNIVSRVDTWKNDNVRELVNKVLLELDANDIGKAGFGTDTQTCDKISEACKNELEREMKKGE